MTRRLGWRHLRFTWWRATTARWSWSAFVGPFVVYRGSARAYRARFVEDLTALFGATLLVRVGRFTYVDRLGGFATAVLLILMMGVFVR